DLRAARRHLHRQPNRPEQRGTLLHGEQSMIGRQPRRRGAGRDRGSASIELSIVAPAVLAVFATLIIGGRVNLAKQAIEAAAFDAARTASLARDAATAQNRATTPARSTLAEQGPHCTSVTDPVSQ